MCFLLHPVTIYCMLEQFQSEYRKDYRCFTAIISCTAHMLVQSTQILDCWHACTDPWNPKPTGHSAPTQPSIRLWAISGGYRTCSLEHRSCRSASAEQSRTSRALSMQHAGCRMTACRMTDPSATKCCTLSYCNLPISSQGL